MSLNNKFQKVEEMLLQIRKNFQGIIEAVDDFRNYLGEPLSPHRSDVYDKLNWETRTGDKDPFQMLRKHSCNNTHLFNHLEAILKQNENRISIGDYHYWAGDPGYIFRRKKKQEHPRAEK